MLIDLLGLPAWSMSTRHTRQPPRLIIDFWMRHFSSMESRPTHPRNDTRGESLSDLLPPASNQQGAQKRCLAHAHLHQGPGTLYNDQSRGARHRHAHRKYASKIDTMQDAGGRCFKHMSGETCCQHGSIGAVWRDDACFDATAGRRLIPHEC